MGLNDEESSVEPYSDTDCREGNHDRVADNHAGPNVFHIGRAGHDHFQSSSHRSRLKIALTVENRTQIYGKHARIIPILISIIFSLKTPSFQMRGIRNSVLMRKATILSGETPFSYGAHTASFFDFCGCLIERLYGNYLAPGVA